MTSQRSDALTRIYSAETDLADIVRELDDLLECVVAGVDTWADAIAAVAPAYQASARNMAHYWALRQADLRGLQLRLADYGLSSLGRSEAHVEASLRLVRAAALSLMQTGWSQPEPVGLSRGDGRELLRQNSIDLLGPAPDDRETRIMVTLPSEAATDPEIAGDLLERGMNIARINCAHDDERAWRMMAENVRAAAAASGRTCLIAMDLGGPKLRTGPVQPGPRVVKLRPQRDALGRVTTPARAWLTPQDSEAPPAGPVRLPVPPDWLARRREGETLVVRDARGATRQLTVGDELPNGAGRLVTSAKTTYLTAGTSLRVHGAHDEVELGALPEITQSLLLRAGDVLRVTRDCSPAEADPQGVPAIGCTLAEVFDNARPGDEIFFDDGKIGGVVAAVSQDELQVRITRAADGGSKLREAKGINVPDTRLPISALTAKDRADLATVVEIADIVQLSFVQEPADVVQLHDELHRLGGHGVGVVLKIETREAFENLPHLLFAAMRRPRTGVMVARGDLAVEVGYERLAELQEEILWLCESAHLPAIWATQVLEQLAKSGVPSRAEISDAALGERAECVMLNKGPHIGDAVSVLDGILSRMAGHHYKKNALLRQLRSWGSHTESSR